MACLFIETDTKCSVLHFHERIAEAVPGERCMIILEKGRHIFTFIGNDCPDDRVDMTILLTYDVDFVEVSLKPIVSVRLEREAEIRRQEERELQRIAAEVAERERRIRMERESKERAEREAKEAAERAEREAMEAIERERQREIGERKYREWKEATKALNHEMFTKFLSELDIELIHKYCFDRFGGVKWHGLRYYDENAPAKGDYRRTFGGCFLGVIGNVLSCWEKSGRLCSNLFFERKGTKVLELIEVNNFTSWAFDGKYIFFMCDLRPRKKIFVVNSYGVLKEVDIDSIRANSYVKYSRDSSGYCLRDSKGNRIIEAEYENLDHLNLEEE